MGYDQPADKKSNNGNQRGKLKIGKSGYGMTRGAATGVTGSKTDQKADNQE